MTNEEMFEKNIGLAYKAASRYIINHSWEIEDIKQVALIGLWKAVLTFKNTYAFSTYAYKVILNEINLYLRKNKKREQEISINTSINDDRLTIEDTLQSEDNIEKTLDKIEILIFISNIHFTDREKEVYDLLKKGYRQAQISRMLNLSKQRVSKIQEQIMEKICKQYVERKGAND